MSYAHFDTYSGVIKENNINKEAATYLSSFKYLKIILLIDDSNSQTNYWKDTVKTIETLFDICTINNPLDIYFLNNLDRKNVKDIRELKYLLNITPYGNKPIKLKLIKLWRKTVTYMHQYLFS